MAANKIEAVGMIAGFCLRLTFFSDGNNMPRLSKTLSISERSSERQFARLRYFRFGTFTIGGNVLTALLKYIANEVKLRSPLMEGITLSDTQ